ncbi:C1 family peptidase [Ruminococcus sp. HUN007]|uniref:C1 family peptidase n=1 Tax=Ruminococcus sp. HUN007 TaxID=1514668 RepID=UPI0005D196E0|nr:C1 family peptidase [Ruminococcus sp. HUN007]
MNRKKRFTAGLAAAAFTVTTLSFALPGGMNGTASAAEDTDVPAASYSAEDITPAVTGSEAASLPGYFDLREQGLVSPVKNQGAYGTCWTFSASGALETSLIKNEPFIDLSELHLAYFSFYGDNTPESPEHDPEKFISGGHISYAAASYARWFGPVKESLLPYSTAMEDIDPHLQDHQDYFVTDMSILNPYTLKDTDADDMLRFSDDEIKQMIYEGNSVAVNICYENTYNEETFAQYDPSGKKTNHGVLIVGWDDSYSRENFLTEPPGDGAWIVKNSWGSSWGDNGYFYMSYYDRSISDACCLKAEKAGRYQTNYQHDELFLHSCRFAGQDEQKFRIHGKYFYCPEG